MVVLDYTTFHSTVRSMLWRMVAENAQDLDLLAPVRVLQASTRLQQFFVPWLVTAQHANFIYTKAW